MKIRKPSQYVLLGASLALMLQTDYRFMGPIGIGESLAMAFVGLVLIKKTVSSGVKRMRRPDSLTLQYLAVLLLVIMPMTFLSVASNVAGASIRDLISYYFVGAVLLVLPQSQRDVRAMISAFLVFTFATIIAHYVIGGSSTYYFSRFTGGAKNPNQLALYLIVSMVFAAQFPALWVRIAVIALSMFFGVASMSDAFIASIFIFLTVMLMLMVFPPRIVIYIIPVLLSLGYIGFIYFGILDVFTARWTVADEGDTRSILYMSAIRAWLDTPFSMIFGHGAGSFSGVHGPFQGAEAHNTALDFATIAGVFGLFLFPLRPLWTALRSLPKKMHFVPAALMGLIAFGLFHFVGRQPVFWVALVMVDRSLRHVSNIYAQPVRSSGVGEVAHA